MRVIQLRQIYNESQNIIFNVGYRPPYGDINVCENYFENIFFKYDVMRKNMLLAGDFSINLHRFEQNKKFQNVINLMFQFGLVPTTNKPTRKTKDTIYAIDHIITNSITNLKLQS